MGIVRTWRILVLGCLVVGGAFAADDEECLECHDDPDLVREFLERKTDDIKVIFSTYQSTEVVAKGAEGLPPIDLAIFDEAHKTTGWAGRALSRWLRCAAR